MQVEGVVRMVAQGTSGTRMELGKTQALFRDLQEEAIVWVLPALAVVGFTLIAAERAFEDHLQGTLPGALLLVLPVLVIALRKVSYVVSAGVLITGCMLANLLVVVWGNADAAISLLALIVGMAVMFIGPAAGTLTAIVCTGLLFFAPPAVMGLDRTLRFSALLSVWSSLALVWLTLRVAMTSVEWSWASHEQSRIELDRARESQVKLKQTLEDLATANLQLTRLERVTLALRCAAEDAEKAKREFVANVSHELRTPLNMVVGFAEVILHAPQSYGTEIPPALKADLEVILRNGRNLSSLIDDVLDLSQVEADQMVLVREHVAFDELVEDAIMAVERLFASKGLCLKTEVVRNLPPVFCDPTRIRQVILNLLTNAARFTDHGGVNVKVWQDGGDVITSIRDTVPGSLPSAVMRSSGRFSSWIYPSRGATVAPAWA